VDKEFRVGVFSPNDPRPWVRADNLDMMLEYEGHLLAALEEHGIPFVRGGDGLDREDQVAWSSDLVRRHVERIAAEDPAVLIINQGSWTFPYDSIDAVKLFGSMTGGAPRVIIWCYKETTVPGLVAGMAAGGGLKRIGVPFSTCYGRIDRDPAAVDRLFEVLGFYRAMWESSGAVEAALERLPFQKYLALGGMSLKMATTTADVDQWQKIFKVSYEALDQSVLVDRASRLVRWEGKAGAGDFEVLDARVDEAITFLVDGGHGSFDFAGEATTSFEKFVLQLSLYYAAADLADEYGVTFMGIKCQDELSAEYCTVCPAAAFLNNDTGPDGRAKPVVPVACENDMDSALTQLLLHLLSGRPAGFGDFRDVEGGLLAIVNCGQHPHHFFGAEDEPALVKLGRAEYPGQEMFYAAGGCSVRGRTPGGQTVTIARLGRQNLRYQLVATVMETVDVDASEHELYSRSWPIMKGRVPVSDETLIDAWPCNHLAFAYGDWTAALAELAHRLDIGYRVFDSRGREYNKPY
jgi:L-fucose isomerase-like protein